MADNAKCKHLQMPLVAMGLGQPSTGKPKIVLMETFSYLNYQYLQKVLEEAWLDSSQQSAAISKPEVAQLLRFAQSDQERESGT